MTRLIFQQESIENAQRGKCELPAWYSTEGPIYQRYESFIDRFHAVVKALKVRHTSMKVFRQTTDRNW
jgi:hypothetical protein